ncbi:hypothetical protein HPP92_020936 [Vanilla planifolia]|uniref:Uncharacterized protein n=1 Tax=Vanilla planifolia TaxID=51239 RepID=A0A835UIY6_VANPL|nr:hypothetical protein HPP92_021255 [Vanilla planifolia]KAG0462460.1 hypothetical protein HPP92_020936 [Vanilla planifolia]
MDLVSSSEQLCYVRCAYCKTVLAVGVPCERFMNSVTVKCGQCNNNSFLSPKSPFEAHCSDPSNERRMGQPWESSCSTSIEQTSKAAFVAKPPAKKHRQPSAYNRYMRDEIQRIKAAKPDIPHREAFSMAAKNWAKCNPRGENPGNTSLNNETVRAIKPVSDLSNQEVVSGFGVESLEVCNRRDDRTL